MTTVGDVLRALSRFDPQDPFMVSAEGTWVAADDVAKECKGGREAVVIYTSTGSGR